MVTAVAREVRRPRWRYAAVAYAVTVTLAGAGIPSPLYGVWRSLFGFSVAAQTLVFAIYALVLLPWLLGFSRLTGRTWSHQTVAALGVALAIGADVLFLLAGSLGGLLAARALQGVAIAAVNAAANVLFVEAHPTADLRRAALGSTLAVAAGLGLGALGSGLLAEYAPARTTLVFVVHLLLLVPALGLLVCAPRSSTVSDVPDAGADPDPRRTALPQGFGTCCGAVFIAWAVGALFLAVGPSYASTLLHTDNLAVAGSVTFVVFAAAFGGEIGAHLLGDTDCARLGIVLLLAGLATTVGAFPLQAIVLLMCGAVFGGAGLGLTFLGSLAVVNARVAPQRRAQTTALFFVSLFLGNVLPVLGTGLLADSIGLSHAVVVFATVTAAAGLALLARFTQLATNNVSSSNSTRKPNYGSCECSKGSR